MRTPRTLRDLLVTAALLWVATPVVAAIQLAPVVSSGLSSPLFVGHAGDGSNRLFIEEQAGVIRVLQPGASGPTVFLDIRARILAGGERGLLGLAFHPQYASNGRFFVFYTRSGDGALVIAEFAVSGNPDVADTTEKVLLTIPHSNNSNHNGGMLAFGPDGFLYIGVGDGGSGNDPPNNAQNIESLLGKILRIDVDRPDASAGTLYSSPGDNPYVGRTGRDEIYSIGWRNPWRFSFDRSTHQQWVADVGQGAREEVDTPIVKGGNYGWRVYEGSACTGVDPSLCVPANYIFPVFDYAHSGGRCSITGGYVYRGTRNTLPAGIYVYGDYCSGEIFAWDGMAQTVLLDTTMNISSFGEDESGEIYVVDLGGGVSRITSTTPCTFDIAPTSQSVAANGATGSVTVSAGAGCGWTAAANASWLHVTSGASGSGNGNVGYGVDANTSASPRTGTMAIAGQTFTVNQAAAAPCTYSISPASATYPKAGGGASVAVTASTGCNWTAVSNADWITISGGASGSGNGTVTYAVAEYTGKPKKRNGTITIAGETFSVRQTK
jgi:glucose/arabinose dehydrogenase